MRRHLKSCAMGVSCLPFLTMPAFASGALPSNGNFVAGSGHISTTATQLTVNQTTKNGIINWGSFSIGAGNGVQINNGSGATLNRVTGNSLSQIDGSLSATGSAYLINQNGIVLTPTGQVVTGGDFVASTRDVSNSGFMAGGNLEFAGNSSNGVDNEGTINSMNGNVVLIGNSATNGGKVTANNGTAGLIAGNDVLLQPSNTGLQIQVNLGNGNQPCGDGKGGNTGDVKNSGTIAAAQALLDAAGGNVYALAGNTGGLVSAQAVGNIGGHVWLTAGGSIQIGTSSASGAILSTGGVTIDANASSSGGKGDHSPGSGSYGSNSSGEGGYSKNSSGNGGYVDVEAPVIAGGDVVIGGGDDPQRDAAVGTSTQAAGVLVNGALTAGGGITINGAGYAGRSATQSAYGVAINNAISAGGAIAVSGTGGNNGAPNQTYSANPVDPCVAGICNYGVLVSGSGNVSAANGNISITGTGGGAGGNSFGNDGVFITGNVLGNADISIAGTGGASTGPDNFGITNEGLIANGGNGNITLVGTSGANGAGAEISPLGVGQIGVVNLGYVLGNTGNISITGSVGANATGAGNFGVGIGGGLISTGGNVVITGSSNGALGGNAGVMMLDFGFGAPTIESASGYVQLTGTNTGKDKGSDSGVAILNGTVAADGTGNVEITGNGGKAGTRGSDNGVVIGGAPADPASVTAGGNLEVESIGGNVLLLSGGSLTAGNTLTIETDDGQFVNQGGIYAAPNVEIRSDDGEHDGGDHGQGDSGQGQDSGRGG